MCPACLAATAALAAKALAAGGFAAVAVKVASRLNTSLKSREPQGEPHEST